MANSLSFAPLCSLKTPNQPGFLIGSSAAGIGKVVRVMRFQSLEVKATPGGDKGVVKVNSIVCADCDGNGAVLCSQCQGTGVNTEDRFNGRFKVGGLCWLCRGKRDILCGGCNGAGFVGGFMSTSDE